MEDWSMIPDDLLNIIGKRLEKHWDVLRFRSVCSSWRSSTGPKPSSFPQSFPVYLNGFKKIHSFGLSRRRIFLLRSTENGSQWLVKAKEDENGAMHLMNPFSISQFGVLPSNFPDVLNLLDFQVLELAQEIVVEYELRQEFCAGNVTSQGAWKTPLLWLNKESNEFALLLTHIYGKLLVYRSDDKACIEVERTQSREFIAVGSFEGKFYAIDDLGRTLVIDSSAKASFLPHIVSSPAKKRFLVESGNNFLLIDSILLVTSPTGYYDSKFVQGCVEKSDKFVKFQVYKLDKTGQKWLEVQSLGNCVIFLGMYAAFLANVSGFSNGCEGNCIIFREDILYSTYTEYKKLDGGPMHLFSLGDGSVKLLTCFPSYSSLFLTPPADWITYATTAGSEKSYCVQSLNMHTC